MESLIYSNSISSKLNAKSQFLPRLARVESTRKLATDSLSSPASFPFQPRPESRRFNPLSCALNLNGGVSLLAPRALSGWSEKDWSSSVDSGNGSESKPHLVQWVARKLSRQKKVMNAGAVILLSAIFVTFFHPAIAPPALATLQSAAKTGAPAAVTVGNTLVRSEILSSAWTGFLAGCLHTLSGPDHLAALAPLSIGRTRVESAAVGALWGCGHDAGQLLFGLVFLLLKDRLHIEIIRTWGTRVVGFTLLVIGAMGIKEASEVAVPCVALEKGETLADSQEGLQNGKKKIGFATFATGIVHGLQPDALMMVLPALALPSRFASGAFLLMFLFGTVIAMGSYTVFIGSCSQALKDRVPRITEKLTWAASLIAIALGLAIIVSQFFGFSLY